MPRGVARLSLDDAGKPPHPRRYSLGMAGHWSEQLIGEAIERGELEPHEGVGEPIPNLDNDPNWWVKKWIERERLADALKRERAPRREEPRDPVN